MKEGIHPEYREVCFVDLSNGFKFVTRSCAQTKETIKMEDGRELPLFKLETTSESHPFYTGTQKSVDSLGGRVEVHQTPSGHQSAVAHAGGGQSAYFRQKRDAVDEYIEGEGQRIEYDGRTDTVRLVGQAVVRRYRGTTLADEVKGQTITYDNLAETFTVQGGEGDGRVRGVLSPRDAGPPAGGAR